MWLSEIIEAEDAIDRANATIAAMGREIYLIRNGSSLESQYYFDSYSRQKFSGPDYCGEEGPDWGVGTRIISARYYWARAGNTVYVTFPECWVDLDWRELTKEEVAREKAEQDRLEAIEREDRKKACEENERRTYERLRAKYGEANDL